MSAVAGLIFGCIVVEERPLAYSVRCALFEIV